MSALLGIARMAGRVLWIAAAVGAVLGALSLSSALLKADSAPQQAAGAAIATAFAAIPYVLARAWESLVAPLDLRTTLEK